MSKLSQIDAEQIYNSAHLEYHNVVKKYQSKGFFGKILMIGQLNRTIKEYQYAEKCLKLTKNGNQF